MSVILRAGSRTRRLRYPQATLVAVLQGQAVRALKADHLRTLSSAASPADDDVVLKVFREQQQSYRDLLEGMKKIPVPLSLDAAAVKKYASDMEALKRKVGIPEMDELFGATLNQKLKLAGGNARKFLAAATEGVDLGDQAEVVNQLFAALDKVEGSSGPVTAGNEAGVEAFKKEAERIAKQHGLDNLQSVKSSAIVDMYKQQLQHLRDSAAEEIDLAKRRDNLEGIQIDISSIKPKFA